MEHDTLIAYGDTVKATKRGNSGIVEATGVRFSGPTERDLEGDYFAPDTDYGPHVGNGMAATLNHRHPMITPNTKASEAEVLKRFARKTFRNPVKTDLTDTGIVARHILDLSDEYESMIFDMVKQGKLRWSSGAPGHMVDRDNNSKITMWHIAEWAYTPTAAEPRLSAISPIKSLFEEAAIVAEDTERDHSMATPAHDLTAPTELSAGQADQPDTVDIDHESEVTEPEAAMSQDAQDASTPAADVDDDSTDAEEGDYSIGDALALDIDFYELENT